MTKDCIVSCDHVAIGLLTATTVMRVVVVSDGAQLAIPRMRLQSTLLNISYYLMAFQVNIVVSGIRHAIFIYSPLICSLVMCDATASS